MRPAESRRVDTPPKSIRSQTAERVPPEKFSLEALKLRTMNYVTKKRDHEDYREQMEVERSLTLMNVNQMMYGQIALIRPAIEARLTPEEEAKRQDPSLWGDVERSRLERRRRDACLERFKRAGQDMVAGSKAAAGWGTHDRCRETRVHGESKKWRRGGREDPLEDDVRSNGEVCGEIADESQAAETSTVMAKSAWQRALMAAKSIPPVPGSPDSVTAALAVQPSGMKSVTISTDDGAMAAEVDPANTRDADGGEDDVSFRSLQSDATEPRTWSFSYARRASARPSGSAARPVTCVLAVSRRSVANETSSSSPSSDEGLSPPADRPHLPGPLVGRVRVRDTTCDGVTDGLDVTPSVTYSCYHKLRLADEKRQIADEVRRESAALQRWQAEALQKRLAAVQAERGRRPTRKSSPAPGRRAAASGLAGPPAEAALASSPMCSPAATSEYQRQVSQSSRGAARSPRRSRWERRSHEPEDIKGRDVKGREERGVEMRGTLQEQQRREQHRRTAAALRLKQKEKAAAIATEKRGRPVTGGVVQLL